MDYTIQELHETIVDQAVEIKKLKQELNELRNELHHLYGMEEEQLPSYFIDSTNTLNIP